MYLIDEFDLLVNKETVYKIIGLRKESRAYENVEKIYDNLLKQAKEVIRARAIYDIREKNTQDDFDDISDCKFIVLCLITIGSKISEAIDNYFKNGMHLEGLILDTIADQVLFNASNELYKQIKNELMKTDIKLTRRLSPGDNNIDIKYQGDILRRLNGERLLDVGITDGFMLKPIKSLAYFYGADKNRPNDCIDHDCEKCDNLNCIYGNKSNVKVKVLQGNEEREIIVSKNRSLYNSLIENNIVIESPCNGKGTCGKCKVKIIKGYDKITKGERYLLSEEEMNTGVRLSCLIYPEKDLKIEIPEDKSSEYDVLSKFNRVKSNTYPITKIDSVKKENGSLEKQVSLQEMINKKLNAKYKFNLKSTLKLSTAINENYKYKDEFSIFNEESFNLVIRDYNVVDILKKDDLTAYGIAIDIGTTTIAIALVDLIKQDVIGIHTMLNSQRQYGADVISRIQYSTYEDKNKLTELIRKDIKEGIIKICKKHGVKYNNVYDVIISGNTTMTYLLLGIPTQSLAQSPFTTVTKDLMEVNFGELFEELIPDCKVTVLPSVSAYVGGDIVSGMLSCGFNNLGKTVMLIDIGTNGEIAIGNDRKILCASTAAGPAFEGANIKDGVGSIKGAIASVDIKDDIVTYKTIGNYPAIGICGSGVIDIVAAMLRNNIINKTGRFVDEEKKISKMIEISKSNDRLIGFYQKDIRELQLAKSAIRAGVDILINKFGCRYDDIDEIYLSGGFGNHINIENAIQIGIIPKELKAKINLFGNSSLGGAVQYLLDRDSKNNIKTILSKTEYIELSTEEEFNNLFIMGIGF